MAAIGGWRVDRPDPDAIGRRSRRGHERDGSTVVPQVERAGPGRHPAIDDARDLGWIGPAECLAQEVADVLDQEVAIGRRRQPEVARYAGRRSNAFDPIDPLRHRSLRRQAVPSGPRLGEPPRGLDRSGHAGQAPAIAVEVDAERVRRRLVIEAGHDEVERGRHDRGAHDGSRARLREAASQGQEGRAGRTLGVGDQARGDPEDQVVFGLARRQEWARRREEGGAIGELLDRDVPGRGVGRSGAGRSGADMTGSLRRRRSLDRHVRDRRRRRRHPRPVGAPRGMPAGTAAQRSRRRSRPRPSPSRPTRHRRSTPARWPRSSRRAGRSSSSSTGSSCAAVRTPRDGGGSCASGSRHRA